jgi:hypothetical protein
MNLDIDNISAVLAVLGAYFAILLVLSVSVEAILEPFSFFKGLRKQASPDDVLKSVEEWLPEGSGEAAKVIAIQTFTSRANINVEKLDKSAKELTETAVKTLSDLGLESEVNTAQKEIAIKLSNLREQHAASQRQRITWLRSLSGAIGVVIAFILHINTFEILGSLFSDAIIQSLSTPLGQIGGVIITGLAASAGSSFWHDMLGQVRNLKETVQKVEKTTYKDNQ